jgi:hypothetical protein
MLHIQSKLRQSFEYFLLWMLGAALVSAFEQGSYYVFDLVETADAAPIAGRLAVPKSALLATASTKATSSQPPERGEFEIDFNQSFQKETNAGFEFEMKVKTGTNEESAAFNSSAFNLIKIEENSFFD